MTIKYQEFIYVKFKVTDGGIRDGFNHTKIQQDRQGMSGAKR